MHLTAKQMEVARKIIANGSFISTYVPAGASDAVPSWFIPRPYSNEDGRVCNGLLAKGALRYIGDGDYELTQAARAAAGGATSAKAPVP